MKGFQTEITKKMKNEGLSQIAIENFLYNYDLFLKQQTTLISKDTIDNPKNIPAYTDLDDRLLAIGEKNLKQTVMIKLNGGLGTSMGLKKAKSLLKVKGKYNFLDIIAKQAEKKEIPLILMDSFNTQQDSLACLEKYDTFKNQSLPLDFLQNKVPKISLETGKPAEYRKNPDLEWCPPGHGDIYIAMLTNGILEDLLDHGIKYAFISNSDNLGATLDLKLLGFLAQEKLPFLMEVAERTESDKKGGHLAVNREGGLILREVAQCPEDELKDFQNYEKYKYFNTNNIWINLEALKEKLAENNNNLKLPLIINKKNLDPRDENSEKVAQLETAMGAAIQIFDNAQAVIVPRTRFVPVKKTNDLLKVRSDLYRVDQEYNLVAENNETVQNLTIDLDPAYYKKIDDFDEKFSDCKIDLFECTNFKVRGNIKFKGELKLVGDVIVECL